ncbi:hypothetical protein BH11VER1_BH11VER1_34140 [soil metagenome]
MTRSITLFLVALLAINFSSCSTTARQTGAAKSISAKYADLPSALAAAESANARGLDKEENRLAYNEAVKQVVMHWQAGNGDKARNKASMIKSGDRSYQLTVTWPEDMRFDELIPALPLENRKFGRNVERQGIGANFVSRWKNTPERKKQDQFMSEVGYVSPVTAVLDFRKSSAVTLQIRDPRAEKSIVINGKTQILAGDFSAVGEWLGTISKVEKLGMSGLGAMKQSASNLDKLGLLALEPPSKDRIPLVLVHGLMSRPMTWNNAINELSVDPVLRKNYQIFLFRYPTGVPVAFSAAKFRKALTALHVELERIGNHRASHHMVLIGHSMGGLLSRAQIQYSGDVLWEKILGAKPEDLNLTKEERAALAEYLEFKPNPYVDRVIFICSPHRGSKLAVGFAGAVGRRMIKLPGSVLGGTLKILQGDAFSNDVVKKFLAKGLPSSIENLSPKSKYVMLSNQLEMNKGVHLHSIIGNRDGRLLTDPKCSDGVVPYASAHIAGAESELIVESNHGAHEKSEAIEEVHRILLLHLKGL